VGCIGRVVGGADWAESQERIPLGIKIGFFLIYKGFRILYNEILGLFVSAYNLARLYNLDYII
jgi:hypothetical protein